MMKSFKSHNTQIFYAEYGADMTDSEKPLIIWGHGWGQDHRAFHHIISALKNTRHIALDFPGFGASPHPGAIWGTADYAAALRDFIAAQNGPVFWAGHSFGGRVALRLGTSPPPELRGLIIIAGAGLKRKRSAFEHAKIWLRIRIFKMFKFMTKFGISRDWVTKTFTGGDYRDAGGMKDILVKTVNEDLSDTAKTITLPTLLLYGRDDDSTPPEMGQRLADSIKGAKLIVLDGMDHYSILDRGRHILAKTIRDFTDEYSSK